MKAATTSVKNSPTRSGRGLVEGETFVSEERGAGVNDGGVLEHPAVVPDFLKGGVQPQGWAVGPMGTHRLHYVGHGEYPRRTRPRGNLTCRCYV